MSFSNFTPSPGTCLPKAWALSTSLSKQVTKVGFQLRSLKWTHTFFTTLVYFLLKTRNREVSLLSSEACGRCLWKMNAGCAEGEFTGGGVQFGLRVLRDNVTWRWLLSWVLRDGCDFDRGRRSGRSISEALRWSANTALFLLGNEHTDINFRMC